MRILILIFPLLLCLTCTQLSEPQRQIFAPPIIVSDYEPDSLRKFEAQSIIPNSAILFGGVFSFTDTLNFITWRIQLDPQHFVMLLLPKYKGKFKTQLRLRIQNGEQIYVSKAYEGWINPQQFKLHEHSYPYLNDTPLIELSREEFLGSVPKEAENEEEFKLKFEKATSPITGMVP